MNMRYRVLTRRNTAAVLIAAVVVIPLNADDEDALNLIPVPNSAQKKAVAPSASRKTSKIRPTKVDYSKLAIYPKRWKKAGADFEMLAWEGRNIVFLTKKGDYDAVVMTAFIKRLDGGWQTYSEQIGKQPRRFRIVRNKPVICAIPKSNLSCGYGCGYVGATGIEVAGFYARDLPRFQKHPNSFSTYYFYEMGRNFFVFGHRHSLFTTGYAVFMRYVCMDRLKCKDLSARTRETIERCEEVYAKSNLAFFDVFTNLVVCQVLIFG